MSTLRVDSITNENGSGSPAFPSGLNADTFTVSGTWTISENSSGELEIGIGTTVLFKIDQNGNVYAAGDVTAFSSSL